MSGSDPRGTPRQVYKLPILRWVTLKWVTQPFESGHHTDITYGDYHNANWTHFGASMGTPINALYKGDVLSPALFSRRIARGYRLR